MIQTSVSGDSTLRINTYSRSLWVSFSRPIPSREVVVILYEYRSKNTKFNLQVITSDAQGVEVKMPNVPTGMYYLQIKDGRNSFLHQVAIQ